jgi:hypothetical protein
LILNEECKQQQQRHMQGKSKTGCETPGRHKLGEEKQFSVLFFLFFVAVFFFFIITFGLIPISTWATKPSSHVLVQMPFIVIQEFCTNFCLLCCNLL